MVGDTTTSDLSNLRARVDENQNESENEDQTPPLLAKVEAQL